jgi:hypothetical protein
VLAIGLSVGTSAWTDGYQTGTAQRTPSAAALNGMAGYEGLDANVEIIRQKKSSDTQRESQPDQSERAKDKVLVDFRECLLRMSRKMALASDEAAPIIVQAAEGSCVKEMRIVGFRGSRRADPDRAIDYVEKLYGRLALAEVIAARLGAGGAEPRHQPQPEQRPKGTPL